MQITNSTPIYTSPAILRSGVAVQAPVEQNLDSVTFSGSSNNSLTGAAFFGGLGVIPLVGFASNFGVGAQASVNDSPGGAKAAGFGALANLGGTVALAGGLLFGSSTVTNAGFGLLGLSGLAGAYAGFVAS